MNTDSSLESLLEVLNQNLKAVKDPKTDLNRAIEILENSAQIFEKLIEKLEVEIESNEKLHGTTKD